MAETENNIMPEENNNLGIDLEELVADVDDISDPSSMDKLMAYVEKVRDEDDAFIELLTERCKDEVITWEQPWYQLKWSRNYPKPVSEYETTTYRTDTICLEEHEKIIRNWRKFIKRYKLPDKLICLARWKNYAGPNPKSNPEERARRFAMAFLSRGLQRHVVQVTYHLTKRLVGYRKGYYSDVEEKIIEICSYHKPKSLAGLLSLILGRQERGIFKRLSFLTNGKPPKKRLKWTLSLASKLVNKMLEYTQMKLEELKNKQLETQIWHKLEKDMDQDKDHLQRFWYCCLHVQLFVRCDVKLIKLKKKVFKILRAKASDSTYRVWSDIRWKDIVLNLPDGFTSRFLYKICRNFVITLKGFIRKPLIDVVEYALQKLKTKKKNKRLRRLRFKKGQLEELA